ncbi:MAG: phenylalanine--tRNA ligase subunit alpha [Candidatus Levybacteria bacterium RIFCSPHIGHO2_12_FULL_39_39]|nr:MAG: Phenylalanine-tRNA ligase alpha subunit [Candidatus Levybacteria bacterium GW2011_GWA1_39_11]KKR25334.1 MAG: Phenylalanine-tRNA ligase alpha subunit [Candidatus Levybacteria bacterium GW2011_GWB1_39_7]KKR50419.1 MAG: Phenylalanine-tRNA ligase alpha subunit [Candidatus Levybacteria bacterium GW2011_GWA2_40_16]OGH14494.1 MAG: phenylalanine--tRNA ligase subunit alpha [Candidatus Levybacteria bacterium RIFCSPHIGHO2_01_FULL_38_96]OGH25500.1 MAG: phenylalanine--tRNA ligase subunit alpha [Cand
MEHELLKVKNDASSLIIAAEDEKELNEIKLDFLGRNGKLTQLLKRMKDLPEERKPEIGRLANEIISTVEDLLATRGEELRGEKKEKIKRAVEDITIPGVKPSLGHLHPMSQVLFDVIDVFKGLGFQAADGPEIETDRYNFEILNFPKDHPARDTQQTLFLDTRKSKATSGETILRTHTSTMQGRIMEKIKPPFRVIVPGKVFRYEQTDASHGFEFWQFEGYAVDKNITFTNLMGTLDYFVRKFFGEETKIKFTSHNFPFTEPSLEGYVSCVVCKGKGCSFCKQSGWVEVLGGGMIHPNVLRNVGIDPAEWQGFAFGTGLSRLVILKYQMDDLRLLTNPDLRILEQF